MSHDYENIDTQIIHSGEPRILGAVNVPIFQSSTFAYKETFEYHDIRYMRLNNTPNHDALHAKLAALEQGEAALVAGSGMAALSALFVALLGAGDHVLVQRCPYGGTHGILTHEMKKWGITFDYFDGDAPNEWSRFLKPTTKAIYVETMTNPLLEVPDFEAVVTFARKHALTSIIDSTFASPVNFRPLTHGFDLCFHSGTKYLNGHSDIVAGAVVGKKALVEAVKHTLDRLGGCLDTHACFLLHRGMKTLAVRVRYQNESTLKIAQFLETRPEVERVYYPGLESHPQHARAKALFAGSGGVVSFDVKGGAAAAKRFISRLHLPMHAPSLGGVESLVTMPSTTTHATMTAEEKRLVGLKDGLVRLSVGLEATADLIDDLKQALQ